MQPKKCKILLVDDHASIRATMRSLLQPFEDIEIVGEAGDGKQALAMVPTCQPDIVLLDLNMPIMNGIETASLIKKSWRETVIIGLCAIQDAYTMDAFLKAGALAVLSKDRFDHVYSTIKRACSIKIAPS